MKRLRHIGMMGAMSVAALGLISAGVHAAFTNTTSSNQTISAGTPNVVLTSSVVPGCTSVGDDCTSITLPAVGPEGSTFDTALSTITINNVGNIPVTESAIQLTASTNGAAGNAMEDEMFICLSSDPHSGGSGLLDGATIVANGPLTTGLGLSPSVTLVGPTLAPGATDEYQTDFYAGENSAECGTTWSDGPHTASAWSLASYPAVNPWVTPAALTNAAEGGAVQVTVSFSYTS